MTGLHTSTAGLRHEDQVDANQHLTGRAFLSRSAIPDIKSNTKIIGICGIADNSLTGNPLQGAASPQVDGWFFSDFYCYHHLFKKIASDQIWLTCVSPSKLVEKYGEYAHGNSTEPGSQRVVLDATMLQDVAGISVVDPTDLLEHATSTIRDECRKADESGRPVLVLIFSDGHPGTFALTMGCTNDGAANHLTMDIFKQAVGSRAPQAGLCLVTTACYSGGYAINPNLNITSSTTQAEWRESISWPVSGTIRQRVCGSLFVIALTDTLLKLTMEGFFTDQEDDYSEMPIYAGLINLVRDFVQEKNPRRQLTDSGAQISIYDSMFSSQDDEWEMEYSKRTGSPLNKFKDRWLQLKTAGERQEPLGGEYQFGPGERIFSYDMLLTEVKDHARMYFASYPGLDEQAKNVRLHGSLNRLLQEVEIPSLAELVQMRHSLDYRISQVMGAATAYKNFWEVDMPDCDKVDVNFYSNSRVRKAFDLVRQYALFDEPIPLQGHFYPKGLTYIACCIAEAGWSEAEAIAKLDSLVKYKVVYPASYFAPPASGIPNIHGMSRLVSTVTTKIMRFEREIRQELKTISQHKKRSIRAMSPGKPDMPRREGLLEECIEDSATANMATLGSPGPTSSGLNSPGSSRDGGGGAGQGGAGLGGQSWSWW